MYENICSKCGRSMSSVAWNGTSSTVAGLQCIECSSKMNDFEIFLKCLSVAYREFFLYKTIHEEIGEEKYRAHKELWDTLILSLELDYKIWLAKILETRHECFKSYKFASDYQLIIEKIEKWRDNFGAHFKSNILRNWKVFIEANPLSIESAGKIFEKIIDLAEEYDRNTGSKMKPKEQFSLIVEKTKKQFNEYLSVFS